MELHKLHTSPQGFDPKVRIQAVKMYLSGEYTKGYLTNRFGMSYPSLDKWINRYGPEFMVDSENQVLLTLEEHEDFMESEETNELKRRIKELEKKLELAKMKSDLLDTMLDIAEDELHIPIRKKYGPQPSKEKRKNTK